jgi:hypothetical protein
MVTPVETTIAGKVFGWGKRWAIQIFRYGKRIATLEERVSALEAELKSAPGDACPYCGERTMRLAEQHSMVKGDHLSLSET